MIATFIRVGFSFAMSVLVLGCAAKSASRSAGRSDVSPRRIVIQTDSAIYTARRSKYPEERIEFALGLTINNHGTQPIYLGGCRGTTPPALFKKDGNEWILAYHVIVQGCEGPRVVIEPNRPYSHVFRMGSGVPGSGTSPVFLVPVPGTYRVGFGSSFEEMADQPPAPNRPSLGGVSPYKPVPDSLRYSNEFELREE